MTDGTVDRLHNVLRDAVRDSAGRDPMTPAGIVDAQSVRGARPPWVGIRAASTRGEGQRPQAPHRGRHPGVAAGHRRIGAGPRRWRRVLNRMRFAMPSVALVWADGGYRGLGAPPAAGRQGNRRQAR